jgi:hypothetical protein
VWHRGSLQAALTVLRRYGQMPRRLLFPAIILTCDTFSYNVRVSSSNTGLHSKYQSSWRKNVVRYFVTAVSVMKKVFCVR